jgi:hypothetical protein
MRAIPRAGDTVAQSFSGNEVLSAGMKVWPVDLFRRFMVWAYLLEHYLF